MGLTSVTNIPKIMRANKWLDGAALMERWFAGAVYVKPTYGPSSVDIIKMDNWALTFPRALSVYKEMVLDRVWANDKARPWIATRLHTLGMLRPMGCRFDLSLKSTPEQHDLHVNFRAVNSGYSDSLDDMVAALGNFSIYVTPLAGEVTPEGGRYRLKLSKVGFHIMDSYDFEGDQDLGYWDESGNTVSKTYTFSGTNVTNSSFRDWRNANKKGSDFLVYSDVKPFMVTPADSFLI